MDRKGQDPWRQLLRLAACLISHRTPHVSMQRLSTVPSPPRHRLQKSIELNGRFAGKPEVVGSSGSGVDGTYTGPLLWDYNELLQYAEGDIAPVFNKHLSGDHPPWSLVDTYRRRVRLPQREYLLVSRVTKMDATTNVWGPCTMTTEYDIPLNGELSEGGDVPWAVLVESGQCDLLLVSYLGIDFQCKGERVYRLLDTTLTFYGVAQEGQTLVYDIKINSFAKKGGDVTMFFFEYNCYVEGRLLIEMRNGVAGFFDEEELAAGKGVVHTTADLARRDEIKKRDVRTFMKNPALGKTTYTEQDMQFLSQQGLHGWGPIMPTANEVQYKLCAKKMLMIDRITHVLPNGGAHGLGLIIGEKILERDHWYFPCHFKGDQVLAGSLVSDGCSQLLKVYMVWLGLHRGIEGLAFRPMNGVGNKVRCRGQIGPHKGKLVYVMEITDIGFHATTGLPYCTANVDIIDVNYETGQAFDLADRHLYGRGDRDRKIAVDFQNIALQLESVPTLGDRTFPETYAVDYPLYIGAMAKGISSAGLVIAAGQRRMLASFGAGGLPLGVVETALQKIQAALPNGPFAVNLIHSPFDESLEKGGVDLFLRRGVRVIEASAFTHLTLNLVRFRVAGLERAPDGGVLARNKIIFKVSRTELAEMAMQPPPAAMVQTLLAQGYITPVQAELAPRVPMSDDVAVEADSGGQASVHRDFPAHCPHARSPAGQVQVPSAHPRRCRRRHRLSRIGRGRLPNGRGLRGHGNHQPDGTPVGHVRLGAQDTIGGHLLGRDHVPRGRHVRRGRAATGSPEGDHVSGPRAQALRSLLSLPFARRDPCARAGQAGEDHLQTERGRRVGRDDSVLHRAPAGHRQDRARRAESEAQDEPGVPLVPFQVLGLGQSW
jgi:3-hydroxymyristoyl/3-hydroxydecanoyl-(acyl carrier protein) dehydratase